MHNGHDNIQYLVHVPACRHNRVNRFQLAHLAVGRLSIVHFVDTDYQLLDTESVGKESVLPSLSVLRDARLKLSGT